MKTHGTKTAIQLAHAGRKATVDGEIIAPSAIAFNESYKTPKAMTTKEIEETVTAFREGAIRAKKAGFDCIEIHAAHGYLINEFLSPLTNKRTDEYGGNLENRYQMLKQVLSAVKEVWDGPLFVRISASDYQDGGMEIEDYITVCNWLKADGADLIDVSSGGVVTGARINVYPGYQVKFAEAIKNAVNIPVGAVGLITSPLHAEEILQNERADFVLLARELLRNPYWPYMAAKELGYDIQAPIPYERGWR